MTALAPDSLQALQDVVSGAPGTLQVRGAGTKRRVAGDDPPGLDMRALAGIVSYDPAECVISVLAGTPVREVEAALAAHGQYLPFDPPCLLAGATIGGTVAAGISGSCRLRYGGVRDFVIGARVVDGAGRLIHSGGQVVKNAAGFLLHHALVGSAGRLGAIGELTFKVFPRPDARATVQLPCASFDQAVAVHERVRARVQDLDALDVDAPSATVWIRVAGAADALPARIGRVQAAAGADSHVLQDTADHDAWRDAAEFAWVPPDSAVVKVPAAPSRLAEIERALGAAGPVRFACGGALAWLAVPGSLEDVHARLLRHGWRGMVVLGHRHGVALGVDTANAFGARVRASLDPSGRFL